MVVSPRDIHEKSTIKPAIQCQLVHRDTNERRVVANHSIRKERFCLSITHIVPDV